MSFLNRFKAAPPPAPDSPEGKIAALTQRAEEAEMNLAASEKRATLLLEQADTRIAALEKDVETYRAAAGVKEEEMKAKVEAEVNKRIADAAASAGTPQEILPPPNPSASGGDEITKLRAELQKNPTAARAGEIVRRIRQLQKEAA